MLRADGEYNNPLDWWRDKEREFPNIAVIARRLLCIPATSAPTERLFSHAGLVVNKHRNRLDPENVNDVVFLHDNWEFIENLHV